MVRRGGVGLPFRSRWSLPASVLIVVLLAGAGLLDGQAGAVVSPKVQGRAGHADVLFAPEPSATVYHVYRHAPGGTGFTWLGRVELQWGGGNWSILAATTADAVYSFEQVKPDANSSEYVVFRDRGVTDYADYAYLVTGEAGYDGRPEDHRIVSAFPPAQSPHGSYTELTGVCTGCHGLHAGFSDQRLLKAATVTDLCLTCHDGSVSRYNVLEGWVALTGDRSVKATSPAGRFGTGPGQVPYAHRIYGDQPLSCGTCHDPHGRDVNFRLLRGAVDPSAPPWSPPPGGTPLALRGFGEADPSAGRAPTTWLFNSDRFCLLCHRPGSGAPFPARSFTATRLGYDKVGAPAAGGWCQGNPLDPVLPCGTPAAHLTATRADPAPGREAAGGVCARCHAAHGADVPGMLRQAQAPLCANAACHAAVASDAASPYGHGDPTGQHLPDESLSGGAGAGHAACSDCHEPHATASGSRAGRVAGASYVQPDPKAAGEPRGGSLVASLGGSATPEYGVCYKCHSSFASARPPSSRPDPVLAGSLAGDVAAALNPNNASFHPIEAQGANTPIREGAFVAGWTYQSRVGCSDCHYGTAARGPHGSSQAGILGKPYPPGLGQAFTGGELCFDCHNPQVYVSGADETAPDGPYSRFYGTVQGQAGKSLHARHVGDMLISCRACHASHGSPQYPRLIGLGLLGGGEGIATFTFDPATSSYGCTTAGAGCHTVPEAVYSWSPAY